MEVEELLTLEIGLIKLGDVRLKYYLRGFEMGVSQISCWRSLSKQ